MPISSYTLPLYPSNQNRVNTPAEESLRLKVKAPRFGNINNSDGDQVLFKGLNPTKNAKSLAKGRRFKKAIRLEKATTQRLKVKAHEDAKAQDSLDSLKEFESWRRGSPPTREDSMRYNSLPPESRRAITPKAFFNAIQKARVALIGRNSKNGRIFVNPNLTRPASRRRAIRVFLPQKNFKLDTPDYNHAVVMINGHEIECSNDQFGAEFRYPRIKLPGVSEPMLPILQAQPITSSNGRLYSITPFWSKSLSSGPALGAVTPSNRASTPNSSGLSSLRASIEPKERGYVGLSTSFSSFPSSRDSSLGLQPPGLSRSTSSSRDSSPGSGAITPNDFVPMETDLKKPNFSYPINAGALKRSLQEEQEATFKNPNKRLREASPEPKLKIKPEPKDDEDSDLDLSSLSSIPESKATLAKRQVSRQRARTQNKALRSPSRSRSTSLQPEAMKRERGSTPQSSVPKYRIEGPNEIERQVEQRLDIIYKGTNVLALPSIESGEPVVKMENPFIAPLDRRASSPQFERPVWGELSESDPGRNRRASSPQFERPANPRFKRHTTSPKFERPAFWRESSESDPGRNRRDTSSKGFERPHDPMPYRRRSTSKHFEREGSKGRDVSLDIAPLVDPTPPPESKRRAKSPVPLQQFNTGLEGPNGQLVFAPLPAYARSRETSVLIDQGVRKIDAREQVSPFYFSQGKGRVLAPAPARGMTELPLAANLGQYPQFAFNPDGTIVHNPIAPQSSFVPSFHFNSAPNIHTVRRNQVSAY